MYSNRLKPILLGLAVIVCLAIAWQSVVYFEHRGKVSVTVEVLPSDSSLRVDNVKTQSGKIYLVPGSHSLVASRGYFDDDTKILNTSDIHKGDIVYMLPAANSAQAKEYLRQHPDIQKLREAAGGAEPPESRHF